MLRKPATAREWYAPPLAACASSLGIHLVLLAVLLICVRGPLSDAGPGNSEAGWGLDTSWTLAPAAGSPTGQQSLPDEVEAVEVIVAIPTPEPAPAADVLPQPAAPPGNPPPATGFVPAGGSNQIDAAREAPAGPPAPPGRGDARFFSVGLGAGEERPRAVVFVIDQSSSMRRHDAAGRARRELLGTLSQLSVADQFQIVLYNTSPVALTPSGEDPHLLRATDRHRRLAEDFLLGTLVDGGTDHLAALELALRLQPDTIVLLTDGDEPGLSARDLATIRRLNRRQAVIHTIEFGEGPQLEAISSLAILSGENFGTYTYLDLQGSGEPPP